MKLFSYQKKAIDAFVNNPKLCFLKGDPGVGKTAISLNIADKIAQRCIIICPAGLRYDWLSKLKNWFPDFIDENINDNYITILTNNTKYLIVGYPRVNKINDYICDFLSESDGPALLLCDESQHLKNLMANKKAVIKTHAVIDIKRKMKKSDRVILISATPMPNRHVELYSQILIANASILGLYFEYRDFTKRFCDGHYEHNRYGKFWKADGSTNSAQLAKMLSPHTYSINKSEVLKSLPDKQYCDITLPPFEYKGSEELIPGNVKSESEFQKILNKIKNDPHMMTVRKALGLHKAKHAVQHIKDLLKTNNKIVVFAHHHVAINHLKKKLYSFNPVVITGSVDAKERKEIVDKFQSDPSIRIFIGQIKASGVGITLTAASVAVFIEVDWSPANNEQAADRIHRIGQTEQVRVQYLVTDSLLDKQITKSLTKKSTIIDQFNTGVALQDSDIDIDIDIAISDSLNDKISSKDRKHALLSPSSGNRWMACPGSVHASLNVPNTTSAAAAEGTKAHKYAEDVIQGRIQLCEIPHKFRSHINVYTAYISDLRKYSKFCYIEKELRISNPFYKDVWGTADAVIYRRNVLHVIDFKYGKNYVSALDNTQLMIYAFLAYTNFIFKEKRKLKEIKLTIVQPRGSIENQIRHAIITLDQLLTFAQRLRSAVTDVYQHADKFYAGDHCRWCPVRSNCKTYKLNR